MKYSQLLKKQHDCPLCSREQGIFVENKNAYLTYSLAPYHKDHILIVPKKHIKHIKGLSFQGMKDVDALERLGINILKKLGHRNFFLLYKEGENAGKSIEHLHIHIVPDMKFNLPNVGKNRKILSTGEIKNLKDRFKKALNYLK